MNNLSQIEARVSKTLLNTMLSGALVGGSFGIIEGIRMADTTSTLSLTSQLIIMAVTWYTAAAVGLISAVVFRVAMHLLTRFANADLSKLIWPGWFSFALSIWIVMLPGESFYAADAQGSIIVVSAFVAFGFVIWMGSKLPLLKTVSFWGVLNSVGLFGFLFWITFSGPLRHGVHATGLLILLPSLLISLLSSLYTESRPLRRWAPMTCIILLLFLSLSWFATPVLHLSDKTGNAHNCNVLLITVDTLREDHLGCYGNQTVQTPHIDRLADQGILFENTISQIPLTNPSHCTIMTGMYPGRHGILYNKPSPFKPNVATLPEILSQNGYKTAAFVSGWTLKKKACRLFKRFQIYDDDYSPLWFLPEPCTLNSFSRQLLNLARQIGFGDFMSSITKRPASQVVEAAMRWLNSNNSTPFFLWIHLFDPHTPYTPPAPYNKLYDPEYVGKAHGNWFAFSQKMRLEMVNNPRDTTHIKALYAGEISYADEQIGILLATLERLGLMEKTLIIFTSDHGESLTEHNYYFNHSHCLYDQSLKVPLIFRFLNAEMGGSKCQELVQLSDIFPTVLEYLGKKVSQKIDGRSLMVHCRTSASTESSPVAVSMSFKEKRQISIRTSQYKYIRASPWWVSYYYFMPGSEEFYDLAADPGETQNLVDMKPVPLEQYRLMADEHWNTWLSSETNESQPVSRHATKRLRSLGYIQ